MLVPKETMAPLRQKHSEMVGIVRSQISMPKYLVADDTINGFVMVCLNLRYPEVEIITPSPFEWPYIHIQLFGTNSDPLAPWTLVSQYVPNIVN